MTTKAKTRIAALGLTVLSVAGIAVASGASAASASVASPTAAAAPSSAKAPVPATPAAPPAQIAGHADKTARPAAPAGVEGRVTSEYDSPGVNLTVRNNSSAVIAVLFRYDGGPSNWTYLNPGESASDASVNNQGIYNSFVYFSSNSTRVTLKANMPPPTIGYRPNITVDGKFRSLDFDTVVTDSAANHNYKVTRQNDIGDTDRAALTLEFVK